MAKNHFSQDRGLISLDNKVIIKLIVPEIEQSYDLYLPINRKIGNVIFLLNKSINELSDGVFPISNTTKLYNADTKEEYKPDTLVANTDIKNGSKLVMIA